MTKTSRINADVTVIWPVLESDDEYAYEHAIVVARFFGGPTITISQNGGEINVPVYALDALIAELRKARKELATQESGGAPK